MRLAAILALAFAILTVAVAADALRPVDRYAIHHLQPYTNDNVAGRIAPATPQRALRPVLAGERSIAGSAAAFAFAPADSISAVILAACAAGILRRRGRSWLSAGTWIAAVVASLAVEGAGKLLVPQITFTSPSTVFGVGIDGSYPSGHTMRAVVVAAMVAALWPSCRMLAALWVVYVAAVLEFGGLHVPSDIAGGVLAGGALARTALALQSGGHAALQTPGPSHLHQAGGPAGGGPGRPGAHREQEQPEAR